MTDKALVRQSARELARLIRTRAVSPVEVLDAYLDVIEALNPKLNAIITLAADQAREAAKRAETAVMKDAIDVDGIYDAIRSAGLELPQRPRAEDLKGRLVNCFIKCEADRRGTLRGRRQIMLDDSDVPWHRHSKGAVGGVAAAAIGDPAVFVSVDAMHQGPQGGGPCIAIIDAGE